MQKSQNIIPNDDLDTTEIMFRKRILLLFRQPLHLKMIKIGNFQIFLWANCSKWIILTTMTLSLILSTNSRVLKWMECTRNSRIAIFGQNLFPAHYTT